MSTGKNVLIIFLSILFIISLVGSITLITTNSLLYPGIYTKAIDGTDISGFIGNSTEEIPIEGIIENSEDELKKIVEQILTNFLEYLRGDSEELNLTIEINISMLRTFFEEQAEKFPVCSPGEDPYDLKDNPLCRPSEKTPSEFLDEVLEKANITLPEETQIDFAEVYGLENENIRQVRNYTSKYSLLIYAILLITILLGTAIFFIPKNPKKGTMFIGIGMVISGTIVLIIATVLSSLSGSITLNFEIAKKFVTSITSSLISKYQLYGGITLGIGVIATGIPLLFKDKKEKLDPTK